jgi:hypothetical protein
MENSHLTLRAALAEDRLEDFVRQEEECGAEFDSGSDFERALALLTVRRQILSAQGNSRGPVRL